MPSKTEEYLALAQRTANGLTRYWESWTDYLTTASRLYKYPFADQLMIYAQHPDPPVVGKHARFLFGLYSSFAEQRACYPYIFPTIFPRAAAGRSLHKRLRNLYCAPAT